MDITLLAYVISISLGTAISLILTGISIRFLKDFKISKKESRVLVVINNFFWVALVASFITNFKLINTINYSPGLQVSLGLIIVLAINYILLNLWIGPKLIGLRLNFTSISVPVVLTYRQIASALATISVVTWLVVLRFSTFNISGDSTTLYLDYLSYIVVAVIISQLFPIIIDKIRVKK